MTKAVALILLLAPVILARPQLISFKDGKIGVNWGGYHAEAGLGGFLTGNAAHGGLSASAGTPNGQIAGAGLGGNLNDGQNGGLFAGASSGFGQGASAALGGSTSGDGSSGGYGAEAHSAGHSTRVIGVGHATQGQSTGIKIVETANPIDNTIIGTGELSTHTLGNRFSDVEAADAAPEVTHIKTTYKKKIVTHAAPPAPQVFVEKTVTLNSQPVAHNVQTRFETVQPQHHQQVPPPNSFDFGFYSGLGAAYSGAGVHESAPVYYAQTVVPAPTYYSEPSYGGGASAGSSVGGFAGTGGYSTLNNRGSFFDSIFNIPISTLTAVNQLLNGGVAATGVATSGANAGGFSAGGNVYAQKSAAHNVDAHPGNAVGGVAVTGTLNKSGTIFDHIFNIPIATLSAVNQFLNGRQNGGAAVHVEKTIVSSG